jgi:HEAT repeat protein
MPGPGRWITAVVLLVAALATAPPVARGQGRRPSARPAEMAAARADLFGADESAALRAAVRLGEVANGSASQLLIRALAGGLRPAVGLAALAALERRADGRAVRVLVAYASHRRPGHRAAALRALGALRGRRSDRILIAALADPSAEVRAVAAAKIAERGAGAAAAPLLALALRGEVAAAAALGAVGDVSAARKIAESIGAVPDRVVAECLGSMLRRPGFGPDEVRLELVRTLARLPGGGAIDQLSRYVASAPAAPPRPSRLEAERLIAERR